MTGYSIFRDTMADMTWPEVDEIASRGAIILIPVGVIEQHGPHLPLGTDIYGAYLICCLSKARLSDAGILSVVAPPYYFGINAATGMFPGSLNVRPDSMVAILTDLLISYDQNGFHRQFIINHHGDPVHNEAIFRSILAARKERVDVVCVMRPSTQRAYDKGSITLPESAVIKLSEHESEITKKTRQRLNKSGMHIHAEERETSLIMRWYPRLLRKRKDLRRYKAVTPSPEEFEQAELGGKWRDISPLGYIGDPSVATKENGELYAFESADIAQAIASYLETAE